MKIGGRKEKYFEQLIGEKPMYEKKQIFIFTGEPESGKTIFLMEIVSKNQVYRVDEYNSTQRGDLLRVLAKDTRPYVVIVMNELDRELINMLLKSGNMVSILEFSKEELK